MLQKKIVSIEKSVKKILDRPLKVANDFFFSSMTLMMNNDCNIAYSKLERVCEQATEAFHSYSVTDSDDKISIDTFKDIIEAVKLIIFSNIFIVSYDRRTEIFVPYVMLNSSKKKSIGIELEKWVENCISQRSKVNVLHTLLFWSESTRKKSETQNLLDQVLNISYQFISEARGLTDMKTKIASDKSNLTVKLIPKFIPFGEEDKTEIILGVKEFESGERAVIKVFSWREKSFICCVHGVKKSCAEWSMYDDDNNIIEVVVTLDIAALVNESIITDAISTRESSTSRKIKSWPGSSESPSLFKRTSMPSFSIKSSKSGECPEPLTIDEDFHSLLTFVLNSTGKSAKQQGHCLGEYRFNADLQCFEQRSDYEDTSAKPTYAYQLDGKSWYIGTNPNERSCFMVNDSRTETIPTSGWLFSADSVDGWPADPTIKIHFGRLNFCPSINVQFFGSTSEEYPYYDGLFEYSEKWHNGRPIYINPHRRFLFAGSGSGPGSGWTISNEVGKISLASDYASLCPGGVNDWKFWDGEDYQKASVRIICSHEK